MSTTERTTIGGKDDRDEAVGQTLGRYKLLERIGEGGFGVVYVAEQREPFKRRVALKIIKLGMDTKAVVARFEAERQALALMDHPNIAKVLDAGATETGRPYFVMELVRGVKLTEYCDQHRLPTTERLELFIQVCQAIQHAHQKGIIHRDIKPSNILVTLHDGVPVPKVIDFGIAKATQQDLTEKTLYTRLQQFIGTPAYMSPEQAEMSGLDVDTRSDIYSLGVLLYELLTGRTPFDPKELMSQGLDALRKTIREKEPVRPSTKLATLQGEELSTTAARRASEAPKLISLLRGDLDWIVMKCLEKDRTRRYDTAIGLAFEIKRHLNSEPILARPPSAAYRFRKTVRRNKLVFTAAGAVAAALLLGTILSSWQAIRARRAEGLAMQSRNDAEKLANFMLEDFYAELEPSGRLETVARLARQAVEYYAGLPPGLQTQVTQRNQAMARARLALITARQGDFNEALPLASAALERLEQMRRRGDRSEENCYASAIALSAQAWASRVQRDERSSTRALELGVDLLKSLANSAEGTRRIKLLYADLLNNLSHSNSWEDGIALCEQALAVLTRLGALDPNLPDLSAASIWADTADSEALRLGRIDDAERLEKQTQILAERVLSRRPDDLLAIKDLSEAADVLATIAARRSKEKEALAFAAKARQVGEEYTRFNPSDNRGWSQLSGRTLLDAFVSFTFGRVTEAVQKARAGAGVESEPLAHQKHGLAHLLWAFIAQAEAQRGNRAAAEDALDQARRQFENYGNERSLTESARKSLGELWVEAPTRELRLTFGDNAAAWTMAQAALARLAQVPEDATNRSAAVVAGWESNEKTALEHSARAALNLGRYADAESALRTLLSVPGEIDWFWLNPLPDNSDTWARVLLAEAVLRQGRREEALKTLESPLASYRQIQAQGASQVPFRQHFARALYVQALAQPADDAGISTRRDDLQEAERLLQGLSEEARQLRNSKELLAWIVAAQATSSPDAPRP